jgi:hypothetical protein
LQEELLWQHQHSTIKSYALGMRLSSWISKQTWPGYRLVAKGGPTAEPAQRAVSSARAGRVAQQLWRVQDAGGLLRKGSSEEASSMMEFLTPALCKQAQIERQRLVLGARE